MTSPSLPLPFLYTARLETSGRLADLYDEHCLEGGDEDCSTWFDADRDLAVIEYFNTSRSEAEHRLAAMIAFLEPLRNGDPLTGSVRELPAVDWAEAWKKFFHTEKVSDRIWIKPSWEPCKAGPGEIIVELDPGMSFGTGQHGTTRGCLQMLDRLATPGAALRLADIGCGSGILAIAAARLGYRNIVAVDNDPDAVRIATENAGLNGVAERIHFLTGDCASLGLRGSHDIVVANILATVLIDHAAELAGVLSDSPSARLVLSGILNPQADSVRAAYAALGFATEEILQRGDWTTLCLKKP
jgi:ribosomal protein L11 methyltransferase